jgi:porin
LQVDRAFLFDLTSQPGWMGFERVRWFSSLLLGAVAFWPAPLTWAGTPPEQPISLPVDQAKITYSYTFNLAANPSGGLIPGRTAYADNHRLTIAIPLARAKPNDAGPLLVLEAYDRNGTDLSAHAIGNQFTVQQIYGVETLAFYSLRLEGKLPAIGGGFKIGRFSSGDDFATWPIYQLAMNNAINGNPQSLPVNTGFSSFPNAVWGATTDVAVARNSSLRLGAYQVTNPQVLRYHGLNWAIHPSDGLLLISQFENCDGCRGVGWSGQLPEPDPGPVAAPPVWRQEPSYPRHRQRLAFGGYWSLYSQPTFDASPSPSSTYGAWFHMDRTLWRARPGGAALSLWGSLSASPQPAVARLPLFWAIGLVQFGPDPRRPQDSVMMAIYQGQFSKDYLNSVSGPWQVAGAETVLEIGYRRRLNARTYLQPNLQLVINPSGLSIPTALVVGLQAGWSF